MGLSEYHQKFQRQSDDEIKNKIRAKEYELKEVFSKIRFQPTQHPVRIAVLGCGDKRFVPAHKAMFEKLLEKPAIITTLDITTEHLVGQKDIVQHDCTKPIPGGPYNITYAHVLLKFIEMDKQWDVIKNSYEAMTGGGIAIHILDKEDHTTKSVKLPSGHYSVPLNRWKNKLQAYGMMVTEIPLKTGPDLKQEALALVIQVAPIVMPTQIHESVKETMRSIVMVHENVDKILRPHQEAFAQMAEMGTHVARMLQQFQNSGILEQVKRIAEFRSQVEQQLQPLIKESVLPHLPKLYGKMAEDFIVPANKSEEKTEPPIRYVPEDELSNRLIIVKQEMTTNITELLVDKFGPEIKEMKELLHKSIAQKSQGKYIFLYLDRGGDLYREPKAKYCYPMAGSGLRLQLVRTLSYEYTPTVELQSRVGSASLGSIRNAINEINRYAIHYLKLRDNLIAGKARSGYKVNDQFVITKV